MFLTNWRKADKNRLLHRCKDQLVGLYPTQWFPGSAVHVAWSAIGPGVCSSYRLVRNGSRSQQFMSPGPQLVPGSAVRIAWYALVPGSAVHVAWSAIDPGVCSSSRLVHNQSRDQQLVTPGPQWVPGLQFMSPGPQSGKELSRWIIKPRPLQSVGVGSYIAVSGCRIQYCSEWVYDRILQSVGVGSYIAVNGCRILYCSQWVQDPILQ